MRGVWVVNSDSVGSPSQSLQPFEFDVAEGINTTKTPLFKYGAGNVTTTETVIWDGGNGYNGFLSSPTTLDVRSTSGLDVFGTGTGAWTLLVWGLSATDSTEIFETFQLNGTTTVSGDSSFIRVFRALIVNGGALAQNAVNGANQGDINIFVDGGTSIPSDLMARINEHKGQTLMCIYTVPKGKTLYVTGISGGAGTGSVFTLNEATLSYKFRNSTTNGAFSTKYDLILYENAVSQSLRFPFEVPEMTDIVVTGVASAGNSNVTASFAGYLKDNE